MHHSALSEPRERQIKPTRIENKDEDKGCLGDGWARLLTGREGEAVIEGSGNLYVGSNYLRYTHN